MIPLVDLKAQYASIANEVREAIDRVLNSGQFTSAGEVAEFEKEFALYCEAEHAVAVNSGTSALHLALLAAGIGPGDEVITVSHTFVATVAAICYTGAKPVLVDVLPGSFTIDPAGVERAVSSNTKAIVPVHLYGRCADMDLILRIANRANLLVIEDAAQAHGAKYRKRRVGTFGQSACFSFYPGKNLGAYGEAGAITTQSGEIALTIRALRDHGQSHKYFHEMVGYNYRMEEIQAAILRIKLRRLDQWNEARRRIAQEYRTLLNDANVELPDETHSDESVHHLFPVFCDRRDELFEYLKSKGIFTGIHYPIPVHLQPAFRDLGYKSGDFPVSESAAARTLSLPIYPELPIEDVKTVAKEVRQFVGSR